MNMIARARQLLATPEPYPTRPIKPTDVLRLNPKFFVVTDELRRPLDISQTIAIAVKENTAMLNPEESLAGRLKSQTDTYADHVRTEIERIKTEQSNANDAHSEYLKRLSDEKAEAEKIHADLTAANNERIADAERTLKGIEALNSAIDTTPAAIPAIPLKSAVKPTEAELSEIRERH